MSIKHQLTSQVENILKDLGIEGVVPHIDYPTDPAYGDYATNVALVAAKKVGKNPMELAEAIAGKFTVHSAQVTVAVARPGFINIRLTNTYVIDLLRNVIDKQTTDTSSGQLRGKMVVIEYTDPNPFKEFHIGHLYNNIVGESLARLLESQGAIVRRVTYQGDVGLHVAKSIWGMQKKMKNEKLKMKNLEGKSLNERVKFLGEAYAMGASAYEDDALAKKEITELNKKIYAQDPEIKQLYDTGKAWSLAYFDTIYERLGSKFEKNYFESVAGPIGLANVKENMDKGIFKESGGAIVFPEEVSGLHTRVFINSQGLPTYEAKELGLAPAKYKDFSYDLSIIVTANEIDAYFRVLLKVLSLIHPELAAKTKHVSHGFVRLPGGKMSSRTGNVITGEWLLDEAVKKAREIMGEAEEAYHKYHGQTDEKARGTRDTSVDAVAEMIGTGAVKYALLKNSLGTDVVFSFDNSISFAGNSGPYVQYTYTRTQSVLRRVKGKGEKEKQIEKNFTRNVLPSLLASEERDLLRLLVRFEDVVEEAAQRFAPNGVASYLFAVAQTFNVFYQKYQILKAEESEREFRIVLTSATGSVIKQGLYLLGIQAPEQM